MIERIRFRMHGRISEAAAVMVVFALLISGCTSQASNIGMAKDNGGKVVDTGFTVTSVGSYDSADTAVVISTDQQNNSVTFMNMSTGKQYTLYYDGTTYVKDKYEGPMTISQIRAGDVVDVNFLKGKRQIASIQLSPAAWTYDNVENYDLGGINKTASIGSSTYSLPDDVVVLSEGKRVEVMDIVKQDVVSIQGIDHKIYSISVERGHGYIRLKNDQPLIGGWIEVGNTVIREITEDMLLIVPEGDYQVFLSNNGATCTKNVTIERNKEVVLDVGDLEIPENKTGRILFSVTPVNAKVTIDHKEVDISGPVELPYGIHQVHLEADGYDSLTKYIQVGSEYAKIAFALEERMQEEENNNSSVSQNDLEREEPDLLTEEDKPKADTVSSNDIFSVSDNTLGASKDNKVYIDSPKGVEVYLDGNYIGMSPVKFKKEAGSHTITLRKSGYMTKSYTIYLYDDKEDITYSFTELEKENQKTDDNTTPSGTTSDKTTSTDTTSDKTTNGECKQHIYDNGICTVCGKIDPDHEHSYDDESGKCTICGEIDPNHEHHYDDDNGKCTICGEINPDHEHNYDNGKCTICGEINPDHEHNYDNGKCTICGEINPDHEHSYENGKCTICGEINSGHEHSYENGKCTICGEINPDHEHSYENGKCTICGEINSGHEHSYENGKCTICGEINPDHEHNYDDGKCTICGKEQPQTSKNTIKPAE